MKRVLVILAALLFAGAWPAQTVDAASGGGRGRTSPSVRKAALKEQHRKVIQRLNLTPEQRQKIRDFKAGYRQRVAEIDAKLHVQRVALENEMEKPEPDAAKVDQLTEGIGKLKAARELEQLKAKRAIEKILTPEQNQELKELERENPSADAVDEEDASPE